MTCPGRRPAAAGRMHELPLMNPGRTFADSASIMVPETRRANGRFPAAIFILILVVSAGVPNPLHAAGQVLVVTATAGFRHDSIETAEQVISSISDQTGRFTVVFARTEEEMLLALMPERLNDIRLVMFVNTTGEVGIAGREGLLRWISEGGSFIGAHSAADTWHESPEYIEMLGGEFETHPAETNVSVMVDDRDHPATAGLESPHRLFEEIYLFRNFHLEQVRMLLSLRASPENAQPGFFPLSWFRTYGRGRVLYTALGHRSDVWTSPWFEQHLTGAILWALERPPRRRAAVRR